MAKNKTIAFQTPILVGKRVCFEQTNHAWKQALEQSGFSKGYSLVSQIIPIVTGMIRVGREGGTSFNVLFDPVRFSKMIFLGRQTIA